MVNSTAPSRSVKTTSRTLRLVKAPVPTSPGKLVITETRGNKVEATTYLLTVLESDSGRAFQVAKIGNETNERGDVTVSVAERYNVMICGEQSSCSCPWGIYGSNKKPCRHVAALTTLINTGKI